MVTFLPFLPFLTFLPSTQGLVLPSKTPYTSPPVILSDRDIRLAIETGRIRIESSQPELFKHVHASSMDLRLGNTFKLYEHSKFAVLDPKNPESFAGNMRTISVGDGDPFIVQPGEFVLGVTQETISLPDDLVARVEGRSSLGRLGIIVHSTAGFVDPGFSGTITLEISNLNRLPVALYPGMRVCQLAFEQMSSPADLPYHQKPHSKYQGQVLPEESRLTVDPEFGGRVMHEGREEKVEERGRVVNALQESGDIRF